MGAMTLRLIGGSKPVGLPVKIPPGQSEVVQIGESTLSMGDFFLTAQHLLTACDLTVDDPRSRFVAWVKRLEETNSFKPPARRFQQKVE